jgi:hypothetical protein
MRYLKQVGLALAMLCALGMTTAASAIALPDVSVTLAGASYPLSLEATVLTAKTKISNVVAESLQGEGVLLSLGFEALSSLGPFEATFQKVSDKEKEGCKSSGDASEEVSTSGTFHIVYTSLSPLTLGILYLLSPVEISCGTEKVKVQGSALASLVGLGSSETTEYTSLTSALTGNGSGKPALKTYYNSSGEAKSAKLETNFGSGFKESAEEVEKEVVADVCEGKMFVVTGR